ncbi:DUF5518 domain-containing protein [Natrarchaeobius chitinivorans]|uniref:DUF5518 domain-containing protein n=1 Tax=Natrarchaeobius chitinivorans TaxID=1679083 RepID=A0A3N6MA29_NATCH|nr:DUF5518 domain-containing protein [Natrarchaeobius chitinivorans]RQG92271.1 hypothetical protein EA473_17350 [Natrarchaeobius chitinivorans]
MSVSNQSSEHSESTSSPDPGPRLVTLRNGVVGGVVAVFLSFLPLSTVIGGGVAGYLDRGVGRIGGVAGGIAGIVAFVPYLLVATYLVSSPTVALPGPELGLSPAVVVAGTTAFALVYVVGLSVLGSLIGGYVYDDRDK